MSVSKTTTLFNSKFPSNDVKLKCQKRQVQFESVLCYAFEVEHGLTVLTFYRLNAIRMQKCKFLCPKCTLKGSYSYANVDLDALFVS